MPLTWPYFGQSQICLDLFVIPGPCGLLANLRKSQFFLPGMHIVDEHVWYEACDMGYMIWGIWYGVYDIGYMIWGINQSKNNWVKRFKVASANFQHDEAFEKKALQMCKQFYLKRSGSENDINFRYITSGRESGKGSLGVQILDRLWASSWLVLNRLRNIRGPLIAGRLQKPFMSNL